MRLRAAGERTAGGMAGDGGVTAWGTAGGLSTAVWLAGNGGARTSGCCGRAVKTAGGIAGETGGMTVWGTAGGEPVKTESVSVRSGSFGGGAR